MMSLSDLRQSARNLATEKTEQWSWKGVLKTVATSALLLFGIFVLVIVILWFWIGSKLASAVNAFYDRTYWMTANTANIISFILVIAFSSFLTYLILCALVGKKKLLTSSVAVAIVASLLAFDYGTKKEIFAEGKDDSYLCAVSSVGAKLRILKKSIDPESKKPCTKIDPAIAAIAQDIIDEKYAKPKRLAPQVVLGADFALSENGLALIYKSSVTQNGLPVLFSGAGYDPLTSVPTFLSEATMDDVKAIERYLGLKNSQKEQEEKKAADKKAEADKKKNIKSFTEKMAELAKLVSEKRRLETENNDPTREYESASLERTEKFSNEFASLNLPSGYYVYKTRNVALQTSEGKEYPRLGEHEQLELADRNVTIKILNRPQDCSFGKLGCVHGAIVIRPFVHPNTFKIKSLEEQITSGRREVSELASKIPDGEVPKIKTEEIRQVTTQSTQVTKTETPKTIDTSETYAIIFRFVNREPKKDRFDFANGLHGNRVSADSEGVYLSSTGEACKTLTVSIDDGPFVSICTYHKNPIKINEGVVYKLNNIGGLVYSRNFKQ